MDDLFQPVRRLSLSQEARQQLLERIADGRLPPMTRVSELDLSRRLGVSRTPLHEAMISLARDGLVISAGRRGWLVAPVDASEAHEIFPILGSLTALAVRMEASSLLGVAETLGELGDRLEDDRVTVLEKPGIEAQWFAVALSACSNRTLKDILSVLLVRATRLELASVRQGLPWTAGQLPAAARCVALGELEQAGALLGIHWRERQDAILAWILRGQPAIA